MAAVARIALFAALLGATGASAAAPQLSVSVSPRPASLDLGSQWRPTITVRADGRPFVGASPLIELRGAGVTLRFSSVRVRAGVFRARVAPRRVGRFSVGARVAGRLVPVGTLTVSPALTGALDVSVLPDGSLVVGDQANYVLRVRAGVKPSIMAGNGKGGSSGDGGRATLAAVGFPVEVASDPRGGITIVSDERRIRRVAPNGNISTLAVLDQPTAHAHDAQGDIFVSELGGSVKRVDATTGAVATVARGLDKPHGLVVDGGALVVCETFANRLVRIDVATGRVTPFATALSQPVDVVRAPNGTFLVADAGHNRIARVSRDGDAKTVVEVAGPQSVAVDSAGLVYFTDRTLSRVLRVDPASGTVAVVLGRR